MANMDFKKQDAAAAGGFSADSYRRQPEVQPTRTLTPLQQKLAGLEQALPAALQQRAAALVLCAAVLLAGVFGIGGAKLHSRYSKVENAFATGTAEDTRWGGNYSVMGQLSDRGNAAANVVASAGNTLGRDNDYVTAAQAALDAFNAALDGGAGAAELYDRNAALGSAIDVLYAELQSRSDTPLEMGTVQTQYSAFNSAGMVLTTLTYNDEAAAYNEAAAGFPANVIGALWHCGEVELFA